MRVRTLARGETMSSSALRTFAFALIVLALLFGVIAYVMSGQIDRGPDAAATEPVPENSRTLAVVAIRALKPYQAISREDVSLVPIAVEPAHYYKDVADVVGRSPVRTVATGLPVTEEAFGRRSALAEAIPPGTQAMSLEISDVTAVGGFVQPGDFVDVLLYLRASGEQVQHSQARVLIRDVRVLAYAQQLINGEQISGETGDSRGRRDRTAVLAVPQADTTRVMLGASLGELRLALRAPAAAGGNDAAAQNGPSAAEPVVADTDQGPITLAELGRIDRSGERRAPPSRSRWSARSTIEVYEGPISNRISPPY